MHALLFLHCGHAFFPKPDKKNKFIFLPSRQQSRVFAFLLAPGLSITINSKSTEAPEKLGGNTKIVGKFPPKNLLVLIGVVFNGRTSDKFQRIEAIVKRIRQTHQIQACGISESTEMGHRCDDMEMNGEDPSFSLRR